MWPSSHQSICDVPPVPVQLVPDGIGGVLAVWESPKNIVNGRFTQQLLVTRRNEEGALFETPVPAQTRIDTIGQAGIAYVGSSGSYSAIDVTTWTPKWTASLGRFSVLSPLIPMAAPRCSINDRRLPNGEQCRPV